MYVQEEFLDLGARGRSLWSLFWGFQLTSFEKGLMSLWPFEVRTMVL